MFKNFQQFEEEMRGSFQIDDTDDNGYLSVCEYRPAVLEEFTPYAYEAFNERDVLEMIFECDVDEDGQISFVEFVQY